MCGPKAFEHNAPFQARPLTFIDVFAGCGGLSLGLKRAGWKGLFAIEKDAFAFETLSANFPDEGSYAYLWPAAIEKRPWDIHDLINERRNALGKLAGKVDLLAGGPPCQGFSHAGRRRADDPRNRLFEAYLDLVNLVRPRFVLIENVRGFQSDFKEPHDDGIENFAAALQERLSTEYDTISSIIKASDFGVPQVRPRFFLVGARKDTMVKEDLFQFFRLLDLQCNGFLAERNLPRSPSSRDAISDLELSLNGSVPCIDCNGFEAIAYKAPRPSSTT